MIFFHFSKIIDDESEIHEYSAKLQTFGVQRNYHKKDRKQIGNST